MSFSRLFASILLSVAMLFSVASTATATATYTYTGNNYSFVDAPYTMSMALDITITFASPLSPNLSDFDATSLVVTASSSDGVSVVDWATAIAYNFRVSTDAGGAISAWIAIAQSADPAPGFDRLHISCAPGITNTFSVCPGGATSNGDNDNTYLTDGLSLFGPKGDSFGNPGSWSLVPEPGTAILLAMGLAGLGWRGRVRRS